MDKAKKLAFYIEEKCISRVVLNIVVDQSETFVTDTSIKRMQVGSFLLNPFTFEWFLYRLSVLRKNNEKSW